MNSVLASLQQTLVHGLAESRQHTSAGPFTIYHTLGDATPWMNYAIPTRDADLLEITAMVEAFRALDRTPRLEFFSDLYPNLKSHLVDAGFSIDLETSVMTLARSDWKCVESVAVPAGPEEARLLSTVTDIAFGAMSTDIQLEMTAKSISEGRMLASLAWSDGIPVSAGFAVGDGCIREIAGISTLPEYRRRGFAGAVITNLLNRFFADGGTIAWLTPGDEGAQLLYASLGFMVAGTQVNATLGAGRSA